MKEQYYENILNIKTAGNQSLEEASMHYNRYEPTEYEALEALCEEYKLDISDSVVDFGCGKGRLNFYLNHLFKCRVTGVEMSNYLYKQAINNKKSFIQKHKANEEKIDFVCTIAEQYEIKPIDNKFYFFNPFSVEIFMKVIDSIIGSVYENKRNVEIILFYPLDEYIFLLEQYTFFILKKEIRLDSYKKDMRNRFMIYELSYINN